MDGKSELCCNLWAIFDLGTQVIYCYAGKTYALEGTDEEKLAVLRQLSAFDYQTVETVKLPERFKLEGPEGQVKKGFTTIHAFYDQNFGLFAVLFDRLDNQLPKVIDYSQGEAVAQPQSLSSDPLCVTTLVCEDEMGYRRAIVTDDDRKWLEEIGFGSALNSYDNEVGRDEIYEEEEDDPLSIRAEIKRYFHGHMDMAKAITECNIYAGAPAQCDLCSGNFIDDGFMVDGAIRGQTGWACMCMNCFGRNAQGLGWGVGQLYKKEGKFGWLQVAGFEE